MRARVREWVRGVDSDGLNDGENQEVQDVVESEEVRGDGERKEVQSD